MDDLNKGYSTPRRYRNRKLGDFLKELDLTEGRATGIPTIIKDLRNNGSPPPRFESDDSKTFFMVTIPVHPAFTNINLFNSSEEETNKGLNEVLITELQYVILDLIKQNNQIRTNDLAQQLMYSNRSIQRHIKQLKDLNLLLREGSDKSGYWVINKHLTYKIKKMS